VGASPSPATRAGIAQTSSFRTATGDGRIGHVDVRDVAAGAAEIAVSPAAHAGKTYWPTGPESLSGNDVAEIFTKVLGRLITFHPISFEEQQQAMIERVLMLGVDDRRQPMTARFVAHIPVGDPGQTAAGDARTCVLRV
jgi:uncharacterized protein YbjT (DUF2867 family)